MWVQHKQALRYYIYLHKQNTVNNLFFPFNICEDSSKRMTLLMLNRYVLYLQFFFFSSLCGSSVKKSNPSLFTLLHPSLSCGTPLQLRVPIFFVQLLKSKCEEDVEFFPQQYRRFSITRLLYGVLWSCGTVRSLWCLHLPTQIFFKNTQATVKNVSYN